MTFPFRGFITLNVLSLHVVANCEPFRFHESDSGKSEWQSIDTSTKGKFSTFAANPHFTNLRQNQPSRERSCYRHQRKLEYARQWDATRQEARVSRAARVWRLLLGAARKDLHWEWPKFLLYNLPRLKRWHCRWMATWKVRKKVMRRKLTRQDREREKYAHRRESYCCLYLHDRFFLVEEQEKGRHRLLRQQWRRTRADVITRIIYEALPLGWLHKSWSPKKSLWLLYRSTDPLVWLLYRRHGGIWRIGRSALKIGGISI